MTAAINAMNGALVVAAVVAVIEIGSPVATNLGLGIGPTSIAGQVAGSQILQNAAVPSWVQAAAASVASTSSPGSVGAEPRTAEALASNVTSGTVSGVVTATPVAVAAVTASANTTPTSAHAAAIVSSSTRGNGAADETASPAAHGPPAASGSQHGNGQQAKSSAQDSPHVPPGNAVGRPPWA